MREFPDVTLAYNDSGGLRAHRVILTYSNSLFGVRMEEEMGGEDDGEEGDDKYFAYFLAEMRRNVEMPLTTFSEEKFLREVTQKWLYISKNGKDVFAKARMQIAAKNTSGQCPGRRGGAAAGVYQCSEARAI